MGLRAYLKNATSRFAGTRLVRSVVANLIYPTIVRCLKAEIQPDKVSPSGLIEAIAWKSHACLVLEEELRPTGVDCAADGMRSDQATRTRIIDTVLERVKGVEGDILEFGVYNGESVLTFADRCPDRHVYGFDSFEGLPTAWWSRPKGAFKTTISIPERPNLTLVPGLFDDSLPPFLASWTGQAAVVHVDCDLYQSTLSCLEPILARCQAGTVLLFDEYYNYPGFSAHEWLAWRELRSRRDVVASCIAYDGRRAAFQLASIGRDDGERPEATA